MKKIIVLLAVAFALAVGTATMFVHLKPATAEPCGDEYCSTLDWAATQESRLTPRG